MQGRVHAVVRVGLAVVQGGLVEAQSAGSGLAEHPMQRDVRQPAFF